MSASEKLGNCKSDRKLNSREVSLLWLAISNIVSVNSLCQMFKRHKRVSYLRYLGNFKFGRFPLFWSTSLKSIVRSFTQHSRFKALSSASKILLFWGSISIRETFLRFFCWVTVFNTLIKFSCSVYLASSFLRLLF